MWFGCGQCMEMAATVTVNDVLDGHVLLDLECLDRIYLNGYVPNLQVGGQVVSFLTQHLGDPIPSPAILEKIGTAFRRAVRSFAADNEIPVVHFGKDDREDRRDAPVSGRAGGERAARCGRDRGGAGIRAGVFGDQTHWADHGGVVLVHQGRPAGDLLLLLCLGRRFRAGVCEGVRLFPVSGQDLARPVTSGPNGRRPRPGLGSPNCPTGSPRPPIPLVCRRSATGSGPPPSGCSPNAGGRGCRCH